MLCCIAGQARLLRLLHKLKVTEVQRHAELLLAVCAASPSLAADWLTTRSLALEPKGGSSRWLVAMTLVGQVIADAATTSNPFDELITRCDRGTCALLNISKCVRNLPVFN